MTQAIEKIPTAPAPAPVPDEHVPAVRQLLDDFKMVESYLAELAKDGEAFVTRIDVSWRDGCHDEMPFDRSIPEDAGLSKAVLMAVAAWHRQHQRNRVAMLEGYGVIVKSMFV